MPACCHWHCKKAGEKKSNKQVKAQISLEFLLVMAGFLLALALFMPVAIRTSKNAFYSVDALKARSFLSDFRSSAFSISFHSDGSVKEFAPRPARRWQFNAGNSRASVSLKSKTANHTSLFTASIPAEVEEFNCTLSKGKILRMEKMQGVIRLSIANAD